MTGPAQIARIITVVGAVGVLLAPIRAHAAAPRDAVKFLPGISHSSEFKVVSPSQGDYQDNYRGVWSVDWGSPDVQVGVAKANLDLVYNQEITDYINRITDSSSSGRQDYLSAAFRINTLRGLKLTYKFEQTDVYSSRAPSLNPRSYSPQSVSTTNLHWELPNLPVFNANYRLSRNYTYSGLTPGGRGEISFYKVDVNFRQATAGLAQSYTGLYEYTESHTYGNQTTSTSKSHAYVEGSRELPMGDWGTLVAGFSLDDTTSRGELESTSRRTLQSNAFLGLSGRVLNFPLGYELSYNNRATGYNGQPGEQYSSGLVRLNFDLPNPPGKRAALTLTDNIEDINAENRATFTDNRSAIWDFTVNPRTTSRVIYRLSSTTDNLASERTEEKEGVYANAVYRIPGERGNLGTEYNQEVTRDPADSTRSILHSVTLTSNFTVSPRASMGLIYSHSYSDNSPSWLALNDRTEFVTSGINYNFNSGNGISLQAAWQQHFRLDAADTKSDASLLDLTFAWQTAASWRYQLKLHSSDTHAENAGSATGYTYRSGEDYISALISYSF